MKFPMQHPTGVLTIDLDAIQANWLRLRQFSPGAECGAVVKADAYGLGMEPVARALHQAGCRRFFVANRVEGQALRQVLSPESTIYLLQGVLEGEESLCAEHGLTPVLISHPMSQRWLQFCESNALPDEQRCSALKINTGMNRLGLDLDELQSLLQQESSLRRAGVHLLMSHLACADESDHPLNDRQRQAFIKALALVREQKPDMRASLANTAAVMRGCAWHFDITRPGIGLYGSNPIEWKQGRMQPVVTLELPVIQRRRVMPDAAVGYGATYIARSERHLVAVAGGYGDGLFRNLGNKGAAWYRQPLPIVGRVSMDSLIVDVTALSNADRPREGDWVEVLGEHIDLDAVAEAAGTLAYEVLTHLKGRFVRRYRLNGQLVAGKPA